jgi:predicted lipid-binding transport protein (Tim44 family)
MSRWLGPIAGIAAGLGLAALLSHLGLSEAFASLLLLVLIAVGVIVLVRFLLLRRNGPPSRMQYAAAPGNRVEPQVGRTVAAFEPVMSGAGTAASANRFPPGFDAAAFAEQAKLQFRKLQAAYDNADRNALADVMTPEMLSEVEADLAKRTSHEATIVDRLDAEVLDVATEGRQHWMSVRFTGLLREDGTLLPKEFEETWNLVKPVDGSSGWMLAGIQQPHEMA